MVATPPLQESLAVHLFFLSTSSPDAHTIMARMENKELEWQFLSLLVSEGYCQLLKCQGIVRYSIIGGTLDDSLRKCFDTTVHLHGLPMVAVVVQLWRYWPSRRSNINSFGYSFAETKRL
jgi:tRNA A37 threonylcarbamoyltransferase TsaD